MSARSGYRSRMLALVGLLVAALTALACGIGPAGPGRPGAGGGGSTGAAPGGSASDQADGTMTVEEFKRDTSGAVAVAERYWTGRFQESGQRFQPIRRIIPYERTGEVDCGGEALGRNNAAYCPAGDFIAYDVNWAVGAFRKIGDAFLFYLLGHEYAHGVQVRLGIRYQFTIQQELQADCMAGAYIGDSVKDRALTLADGDLDELRQGLFAVGDAPDQPWFAEGAHGSAEQRTESFFRGYERSLDACDLT
ncbi:neutral zinc metallopeptidase [Micromonospora sp. NPDC049559]|uniref:neutral zinc metallopeptidase n=1 Tax=Micromonospora sp. NPDC049559 TaxID=3155923 RepID=UPI0034497EA0